MTGEFLKRALAVTGDARSQSLEGQAAEERLKDKCWPEILAVVEAAQQRRDCVGPTMAADLEIWEALEALDKKAGEL
jgi:hypothetical protein